MKFGVREICDVVFKAKSTIVIGDTTYKKGQPVLYIDSAKTSTIEGAATTVYAQGGKGNTRLIAWEGEKTLTFTVEDALLSPISFSMLSGAGLIKGTSEEKVHVHTTARTTVGSNDDNTKLVIDLSDSLRTEKKVVDKAEVTIKEEIDSGAPIFIGLTETDGSLTGKMLEGAVVGEDKQSLEISPYDQDKVGQVVMVDFYVAKPSAGIDELQIDAANFGGYFYVEASTLFRRQDNGKDMPAEITLPNVKIQSNFTFSMASSGDPSTFTFTMDAFPGYTMFDRTKQVLCVIQIIDEDKSQSEVRKSVMPHPTHFDILNKKEELGEIETDSTPEDGESDTWIEEEKKTENP